MRLHWYTWHCIKVTACVILGLVALASFSFVCIAMGLHPDGTWAMIESVMQ